MRARDVGLFSASGPTGALNAIVDVPGVAVGHVTLIDREGPLVVGEGPVRTGVTVVLPRPEPVALNPVFAGIGRLNGNGEMTGSHWIEESGLLTSPIALTNTHSVGVVRDALVQVERSQRSGSDWWSLPVVAETWDGFLNDINGFHVRQEHVFAALDSAQGGPVEEGSVGGGTGMRTFGFKAGIGTSSRIVEAGAGEYTIGVLVQSNFGSRNLMTVAGVPVGREIPDLMPERGPFDAPPGEDEDDGYGRDGSIIIVAATDAPLLPHQLNRFIRRTTLALAPVQPAERAAVVPGRLNAGSAASRRGRARSGPRARTTARRGTWSPRTARAPR